MTLRVGSPIIIHDGCIGCPASSTFKIWVFQHVFGSRRDWTTNCVVAAEELSAGCIVPGIWKQNLPTNTTPNYNLHGASLELVSTALGIWWSLEVQMFCVGRHVTSQVEIQSKRTNSIHANLSQVPQVS